MRSNTVVERNSHLPNVEPGSLEEKDQLHNYPIKQALFNTGQIHTWDFQRMAVSYIGQMLIKTKSPKPLHRIRGKNTSWCTSCLCISCLQVNKHTLCSWDSQPCVLKWKHVTCYVTGTTTPSIPGSDLCLDKWILQLNVSPYTHLPPSREFSTSWIHWWDEPGPDFVTLSGWNLWARTQDKNKKPKEDQRKKDN